MAVPVTRRRLLAGSGTLGAGIAFTGAVEALFSGCAQAAEVGGTCLITSRPGAGTIVSARLPLTVPDYHRASPE